MWIQIFDKYLMRNTYIITCLDLFDFCLRSQVMKQMSRWFPALFLIVVVGSFSFLFHYRLITGIHVARD